MKNLILVTCVLTLFGASGCNSPRRLPQCHGPYVPINAPNGVERRG